MWGEAPMAYLTASDLEHVPMMDFAAVVDALVRWLWP
jgi:hypothetical protein